METTKRWFFITALLCMAAVPAASSINPQTAPSTLSVRRVLLISIDGLHAIDLANFIRSHPNSALAELSSYGLTYTQASTSKPSNSFPGLLSMVTGGSPISTGVWYEGAYDRSLSPPGSNCKTIGTEVIWSNVLDKDRKLVDAGGGIDPMKLPLDPGKGCTPVYPHSFLRVNTIFEVVHSAGMRTAWIDKHPSYEMVSGPSGNGVDDLYTPEIGSAARDLKSQEAYDDLKVEAILNQINGRDHSGKTPAGVPALFGAAFQVFRFAQVIPGGGYANADGVPSPALQDAIEHTDQSIRRIIDALKERNLLTSTLIVISAKHAQAPIDPSKRRIVEDTVIPNMINQMQPGLVALSYADGDLTSVWLKDQKQSARVAELLTRSVNESAAGIQNVLWGESLKVMANDPIQDVRVPDIVVVPNAGTMYAEAGSTGLAAHGGFAEEDTHVALLVSNPALKATAIKTPVETAHIAPTILTALGLNPNSLKAVEQEHTTVLPAIFGQAAAQQQPPLKLIRTTPLDGFNGDLDHFAVDLKGNRLFLAAEEHKTVEVFDLRTGERIRSITGIDHPLTMVYLPGSGQLAVTDGDVGAVRLVDTKNYSVAKTLTLGHAVDHSAFNPQSNKYYVETDAAAGQKTHTLSIIDAKSFSHVGDIPGLPGDSNEAMVIDHAGKRLYVNLTGTDEIGVIDLERGQLVQRWPLPDAHMAHAIALDEDSRRLFTATRNPAKLIIFNMDTGKAVTTLPCVGVNSDMWFDKARKRIYVTGSDTASIFEQRDANRYEHLFELPTAYRAKSSVFVPQLNRLYVAVSGKGKPDAKLALQIYQVQ